MGKYHLPDGETLVTDLQCLVVYTPRDPAYRQALWGAISQLTKYWMWEPDGSGGEHDAADSWDLAYAATLESFGMLEQLLESVDEVEPLLRQMLEQERCCDQLPGSDGIIAESESDAETSDTDVSGGVFPDGIADENEWDPYICNAATALVDRLIAAPSYITQFASFTISTITAIVLWYTAGAYIAIAGAIGGVLTLLDLFDLIDVFENLVKGITEETEDPPGAVESALQAIRDDLICDIVTANDADAAASAVNNRIDGTSISTVWKNLFLLFFTNEHFMAAIYNGHADEAPGSTCDCTENIEDFEYFLDSHVVNAPNHSNKVENEIDGFTTEMSGTRASGNQSIVLTQRTLYRREPCPQPSFPSTPTVTLTISVEGTIDVDGSTGSLDIDIYGGSVDSCPTSEITVTKLEDAADVPTPGQGVSINEEHSFEWPINANRDAVQVQLRVATSCQNYDLTLHARMSEVAL